MSKETLDLQAVIIPASEDGCPAGKSHIGDHGQVSFFHPMLILAFGKEFHVAIEYHSALAFIHPLADDFQRVTGCIRNAVEQGLGAKPATAKVISLQQGCYAGYQPTNLLPLHRIYRGDDEQLTLAIFQYK